MIYKPLNKQERETRVVALLPASDPSNPIACILGNCRIDDAPPHGALSYC